MTARGRVLGRKRRANVAGGRPHRVPVWLSDGELAVLQERAAAAGGISLQAVLVEAALSPGGDLGSSGRRAALEELFAVRRVLSGIAVNINQAARRANAGDGFPVVEARGWLVEARGLAGRIDAAIDGLAAQGVAAG